MRCTHPSVQITETGTASTAHWRIIDTRGNVTWEHDSDFGDYTGPVIVECPDCGLLRQYGKRRPQWLTEALAEAIECQKEDE